MKKIIPLLFVIIPIIFVNCKKLEVPLSQIYIMGDSTIIKGETRKYTITFLPSKATNTKINWSSSDENVITIAGDGTATAKNYGNATIYAHSSDGSNTTASHNVYVLSETKISIRTVNEITYYSAKFSTSFTNGSFSNFSYGLYFNTVSEVDSLHNIGQYIATNPDSVFTYNILDPNTKYYARAYIRNKFGITYSDSVIVQTATLPTGIMGNYMLNNALSNGYIAKCDNWIYFVNQNNRNKLYRIKDDLTGLQRIGNDSAISSINIIPPYIFYDNGILFKSKLDGSGEIPIPASGVSYLNAQSEYPFQVQEGEIYYVNSNFPPNIYKLYKISTQGTNMVNLTTTGISDRYINIYNNNLYYVENTNTENIIYSCNLDGSGKTEVYRNTIINSLGLYQNSMFFTTDNNLISININNLSLVQTLPIKIYQSQYNIANYNIFFSNQNDAKKLYKSDINGLSVTKLCDDVVFEIHVIDDWLYYYSYDGNKYYLYRIKQDGSDRQLVN